MQTARLRLSALVWGPATGRPVLALHGWQDNAASFEPLASHLTGIRLVALDLPGHALSEPRPAGCHYHFVDYLSDVLAAADALGWERFSLLGHSLGAGIASFLASAHPQRIERLVLIEGLGPLSEPAEKAAERLRSSLQRQAKGGGRRRPWHRDLNSAATLRSRGGHLSIEAGLILARRGTEISAAGARWRNDPRLDLPSPYYFTEPQVLSVLSAIEVPALLLLATEGLLSRRETTAQRRTVIPDLLTVSLAGGHHLHMENPEVVAQHVNTHLAS